MADLGVAHLAVGQADEVLAGAEEGAGVVAEEGVVDGLAGLGDGVAMSFGAVAPAVEDGEDDWFGHQVSGYQELAVARGDALTCVDDADQEQAKAKCGGLSTASCDETARLRSR